MCVCVCVCVCMCVYFKGNAMFCSSFLAVLEQGSKAGEVKKGEKEPVKEADEEQLIKDEPEAVKEGNWTDQITASIGVAAGKAMASNMISSMTGSKKGESKEGGK